MFPFLKLLFVSFSFFFFSFFFFVVVYFSEQAEQELILFLVENSWKAAEAEYTCPGNRCCYKPALWALE